MKLVRTLLRRLPGRALLPLLLTAALLPAQEDRTFTPSPALAVEIPTFIRLLEEVHYNREKVTRDDYRQIIPDYMGALDGQRLFFSKADKDDLLARYGDNLYYNIYNLKRVDAAYDIFKIYEKRVHERVNWVLAELDKDIDLSAPGTYTLDRSKAEWPAASDEADALWHKRLQLDLVQEMLNDKPLDEARTTVRKRYERMLKNVGDVEASELAELFLSTLARLYDPHSTYFSADTYEDFGIQMKLQLVGIGALLGIEEDLCVIKEIIPGGPADVSKLLRPNDKIIAVGQGDEEPTEVIGVKLRRIVDLIRGQKGTKVHLVIQPAEDTSGATRREIVLTRDVVKLESQRAHASIYEVPSPAGDETWPIGVVTLPAFYGGEEDDTGKRISATNDVAELISRLQKQNIKGLVLDLRGNGGGLLTEAIALTGLFIDRGPVVQVRSYYGNIDVSKDDDPSLSYDGPLAVLVSKFSASASEIVAGALQNYGRALIIGDSSTHGKGTVQTVVEMRNFVPALARSNAKSGAAKLTIQKFYLPSGSSTQLKGVVPDIALPSIDDYLPVGEKDLPHALVWDEIPESNFDGEPLDPAVLDPLRAASRSRQETLGEFDYLRNYIDWFKARQDRKTISVSLDERRQQKEADDQFRDQMKSRRDELAKSNFASTEVLLSPKPAENIKAEEAETEDGAAASEVVSTDLDDPSKLDIHLRESLRVIADAISLGGNTSRWAAGDRLPLTAQRVKSRG